jgi:hypothetical protein
VEPTGEPVGEVSKTLKVLRLCARTEELKRAVERYAQTDVNPQSGISMKRDPIKNARRGNAGPFSSKLSSG